MALLKRGSRDDAPALIGWSALIACAICAAVAVFAEQAATSSATAAATEYQLKAVFLFNFARFVEWPAAAFASATTPISICVLGKDPFGAALDDAVRNEDVAGRTLSVRRFEGLETGDTAAQLASVRDLATCHILFVAASAASDLAGVAASLRGRGTLIVSDAAQHGAMIAFVKDRKRIRLRIDLAAANDAGLAVSSKLLRLAEVVGRPPG